MSRRKVCFRSDLEVVAICSPCIYANQKLAGIY